MKTRQQWRRDNIHRRKLFGGRMTAEEAHAKMAFPPGARCEGCKAPHPTIRIITMCSVADAKAHIPLFQTAPPQFIVQRMVMLKGSDGRPDPFVRIGVAYSCRSCEKDVSKVAAKLPSWVLVEFNRGPGPDKPMVQVAN